MVYGRLRESAYISGHTFERVCAELEWLLTDERWRQVGPGYDDVNHFLRSVDFSAFNLQEKRPLLVRRIKALQPEASNRAIADALGVSHTTVDHDVNGGHKLPRSPDDDPEIPDAPGQKLPGADDPDDEDDWAGDKDDATMLRVYANENATQRGNTGAAQAGTVASAVRIIAKAELTGGIGRILPISEHSEECLVGRLTSEDGIGWQAVVISPRSAKVTGRGSVALAIAARQPARRRVW
jgi:hypothetical protein